jgi:putative phosphoesterase
MVRVLLIADVHSNWPALKAMQEDVVTADFIIHAGDTIGYGPYPNEVINWLRDHADVNVMGNHDYSVVSSNYSGFGNNSQIVLKWTDDMITAKNLKYLSNLKDTWTGDVFGIKFGVVHGGLSDPYNEFIHPYTEESIVKSYFQKLGVKVLVTGHVHQLFVRQLNSNYHINPGAIGQPRDNTPQPSYVLLTIENNEIKKIEPRRFNYNIDEYRDKVLAEKLPRIFADRLYEGR